MKKIVTILFVVFIFLNSNSQTFRFEFHKIGEHIINTGQTSLIDIDKDGDLDWVYGQRGEMYWYEYISSSEWVLHELGKGARTDVGGCPHDVNGDGWMDYIVGDSWYENTGNPRKELFILHKKNMIACHDNVMVDIDNDGIKDVVSLSNDRHHPVMAWYKMPEDYSRNWDYNTIGMGIHGGISPAGFADLDNDGDIDLVRGDIWFENLDGKGQQWEEHKNLTPEGGSRAGRFGLALKTWCIDLDKNGLPDIIQAEADTENGRVFWFENKNNGKEFVFHLISEDSTGQDFHSLAVADFDNDGDPDVLSGGGPLTKGIHKLFIWENVDGRGFEWKEHLIIEGVRTHETVAADVDGDGDIDICSKPWKDILHIYLENKLK